MQYQSETIAELAAALATAQGEFEAATKEKENPAFKSKYADLSACIESVRAPLAKHGLSVVQVIMPQEQDVMLCTKLIHKSGEWIASYYPIVGEWGLPQKIGSAITYARRYTLCALLQIAQEDDDAESAMGRGAGASNGNHAAPTHRYPERQGPADRIATQATRQAPARPATAARPTPVRDDAPLESFGEPPPRR